jgi:hypothetical protein
MTAQYILRVWNEARASEGADFYENLKAGTGLTEEQVTTAFADWNRLSYEEAFQISRRQGLTVREGGFQAYLAEQYGQTPVQETL